MIISSVKADVYSAPVLASSNTVNNEDASAANAANINNASNSAQEMDTKQSDTGNVTVQKTKNVSKADLESKTDVLNKFMQSLNPDLQFSIHEKTQKLMVRFVDVRANRVLKEFPAPAFLDMVADIGNYVGMLLDKKL